MGNGLRTKATPGPAPFGIIRSTPGVDVNFEFGTVVSKWMTTWRGSDVSMDVMNPVD
jgi:hypothetical protein